MQSMKKRLTEAQFQTAIKGLEIHTVERIEEAMEVVRGLA